MKVATFFTVGRIDRWMQHSIFNVLYLKTWVLMTAFNFQFVVKQWFDSCSIHAVLMCEPSLLHLNSVASCWRFEWLALIFNMQKCAREVGRKMRGPNMPLEVDFSFPGKSKYDQISWSSLFLKNWFISCMHAPIRSKYSCTDCLPLRNVNASLFSIMQGVTVLVLVFVWCTQTVHAQEGQ